VAAHKQQRVALVAEPIPTTPEAAAQQTKVLTAVVGVAITETPIGSMPAVAVVVPAERAATLEFPPLVCLVARAAQVLRTALLVLQRVTPVVAAADIHTKQHPLARSKVENVVPPWWVAQVRAAQTQLRVQ
jgi:hypothetical protein